MSSDAGLALRVLHAREAHAGCNRQFADAAGDDGVVGRECAFCRRASICSRRFFDALIEAAKRSGLDFESLQLKSAYQRERRWSRCSWRPSRMPSRTARTMARTSRTATAGDVPGERRGQALAEGGGGSVGVHCGPPCVGPVYGARPFPCGVPGPDAMPADRYRSGLAMPRGTVESGLARARAASRSSASVGGL